MKTKFLIATMFLCMGLMTVGLSGCSFGGHIGNSHTVSIK